MSFDEIVLTEEERKARLEKYLRVAVRRFKKVKTLEEYLKKRKVSLERKIQQIRDLGIPDDRTERDGIVFRHIRGFGAKRGINGKTLPTILAERFTDSEEAVEELTNFILHHESLKGPPVDRVEVSLKKVDEQKMEAKLKYGGGGGHKPKNGGMGVGGGGAD